MCLERGDDVFAKKFASRGVEGQHGRLDRLGAASRQLEFGLYAFNSAHSPFLNAPSGLAGSPQPAALRVLVSSRFLPHFREKQTPTRGEDCDSACASRVACGEGCELGGDVGVSTHSARSVKRSNTQQHSKTKTLVGEPDQSGNNRKSCWSQIMRKRKPKPHVPFLHPDGPGVLLEFYCASSRFRTLHAH